MKKKYEIMNGKVDFYQPFSKHIIIINDNDYSNPYDESNDKKTKIKE